MHGALIGDLHQPLALLIVERTVQRDSAVDVIERTDFGIAVFAILSMLELRTAILTLPFNVRFGSKADPCNASSDVC